MEKKFITLIEKLRLIQMNDISIDEARTFNYDFCFEEITDILGFE